MNKKELVQRRESERRVKGEGDISAWKTETFKCQVSARQTPLIAVTYFAHHFSVCFYFYQSGAVSEESGRITRISSANSHKSLTRSTMNDCLQCVIVHLISQQQGSKDEEL